MDAQDILQAWRKDSAELASTKGRVGWIELTLPFSTLTDKFVRVYIKHGAVGDYIISDNGDLHNDEYEVGEYDSPSSQPYQQAQALVQAGHYENIKQEGEGFYWRVTNPDLLTSALFDMAQFIQLSVNVAALHQPA